MFYFATFAFWFAPGILSFYGHDSVAYLSSESAILCVVIFAYRNAHMRDWRKKIMATIFLCVAIATSFHNVCVNFEIFQNEVEIAISGIFIFLFSIIFGSKLLTKWDNLPNDAIRDGYIYEIIGKPRTDLQMLGFVLTAGKGGEFGYTNGVKIWKFCKSTGRFEEFDFYNGYLTGKKIVEVGHKNLSQECFLKNKIGSRWSIFNNCITLGVVRNV